MKIGRRRRAGGSLSTSFQRVLRRHIESYGKNYATVDEIVGYLRASFPEYGRHKLQPFTRTVQKTLEHTKSKSVASSNQDHPSTSNLVVDGDEDGVDDRRARKKAKRIDATEDRLQRLENQHIRRKRRDVDRDQDGDHQFASSSDSESSDEADGAVSTSEDAIYGEEMEPKFDLMKSMLRASYGESKGGGKLKKTAKEDEEENDMELEEVVSIKVGKKVDLLEGFRVSEKIDANCANKGGGGEEEVKGKNGPRFRDLGGMDAVLEELKMEVIVPLYHPQLPSWLGVRPMAGILLHGPPGCGKTKLAHAIANETGVPFYRISATELVSGTSGIG
ncbi:hypothetical protein U1Q18_004165 [Sarracenia purpurea var. burkii]